MKKAELSIATLTVSRSVVRLSWASGPLTFRRYLTVALAYSIEIYHFFKKISTECLSMNLLAGVTH